MTIHACRYLLIPATALALAVSLAAVSLWPVAATAAGRDAGQKVVARSAMPAYEKEIAGLEQTADDIVRAYNQGKPVDARVAGLVGNWEHVDFHEALETHAIALYPPIWEALGGFSEALKKKSADARVVRWRNRFAAALHEGVGALKFVAASDTARTAPKAVKTKAADARSQTAAIKTDLDKAYALYRKDRTSAAVDTVHAAYMQRFEGIEGDLIEQDADLVTSLETDFNATLPRLMKNGASPEEVQSHIERMNAELDHAQTLLDKAEQDHGEVF